MTSGLILSVMDGKIEQGVCSESYVKLGKSPNETSKMLCEARGEHSLSQIAVFEEQSCFKVS
jgi:hypothetical protein